MSLVLRHKPTGLYLRAVTVVHDAATIDSVADPGEAEKFSNQGDATARLIRAGLANLEAWEFVPFPGYVPAAPADPAPVPVPALPGSRWRHAEGLLFCGTLRIAAADFDTDPSPEFRARILDEMVAKLNQPFLPGGVVAVANERFRQLEKGFTPRGDDEHTKGELVDLAIMILDEAYVTGQLVTPPADAAWQFHRACYVAKKYAGDRRSQLAIAGALVAAEIDRLVRAEGKAARG